MVVTRTSGEDPGFQVGGGGAHLKKMRRAEGGAKIVGVFRVKNHDFTPKYHIFSNFGGRGARRLRPWTCLLHYTCKTTNCYILYYCLGLDTQVVDLVDF